MSITSVCVHENSLYLFEFELKTVTTSHWHIRSLLTTHDGFTLLYLHWLLTMTTRGIWSVVRAPYV